MALHVEKKHSHFLGFDQVSRGLGSPASRSDEDPTRFDWQDFTKRGCQQVLEISPANSHIPDPAVMSSASGLIWGVNQLRRSALDANLSNEKQKAANEWKLVPVGACKHVQTRRITHPHYLILSQDAAFSHLYKTASAPAAYRGLQMENNDTKYVFFSCSCVYRCSLPLPPTPPQPPSEWGASRELPTERMCVFQKPLSLRLPFFLFPFFQSWCQISARRWFDAIFSQVLGRCFVPGYKRRAPNSRQGATSNGFFFLVLLFRSLTFIGK